MPPPPPGAKGPTLPFQLLKELGASSDSRQQGNGPRGNNRRGGHNQRLSRKDQRKQERTQQKVQRSNAARSYAQRNAPTHDHDRNATTKYNKKETRPAGKEVKPILKKRKPEPEDDEEDEDEDMEEEDDGEGFSDFDDLEDEDEDKDEDEEEEEAAPAKPVPKKVKEKLAEDDAEIAALEKKLGLKGRKKLPKSFEEDGLGDILGDLHGEDDETRDKKKRKAEADDWLAQKRRKAAGKVVDVQRAESESDEDENDEDLGGVDLDESDEGSEDGDLDGDEDIDDIGSEEEGEDISGSEDGDDFGGFDEDEDEEEAEKPAERVRENPYVAPTTGNVVKYVPPSMRKATGSEAELTARIRRQTQGLINRITESNLLSILSDIEKLYRDNARQHISTAIVDLLLIQVCDPTSLPDTLLILTAGFATAVYKVIGMDFGAQLIQETVERFSRHHKNATAAALERPDAASKETSNLITFMSELYNFQMLGPNLLFDYIRQLLNDLTELNSELLLRIVRMCGPALRQDDPMALKDIVALIRPAVAKIGEQNLSVRTKFMIETINDLKNNKMKTGANASAVVAEHTTRMKKLLGSISANKVKSTEPIRIGLKDIQDSDKKGKWWLVGASWAGTTAAEKREEKKAAAREAREARGGRDDDDDWSVASSDDDDDAGVPDLAELAREQQMNTDVRRSIFVAILSATDYEDAYMRVLKLRLNKDRQREIPNVIIQCSGAEQQYNPYYTLIAKRLCQNRTVRWSFQDALWKLFRRLGESIFGEEAEDEEEQDESMDDMRRLVNIAKTFGSMVASGALGLGILKCLNLPYLQAKTRAFVEVMLITMLLECYDKGSEEAERHAAISKVFRGLEGVPELARGLQWFIKKVVRKSDLAGGKAETKAVKEACKLAEAALTQALTAAEIME
ncbi:hypothetical protein QBC46DRAFT_383519 [Diplogelasinospora grovesii]|uniref:MI domain-containing protein n=1 Tax=Diplogelasinospora grovesii TaxID=303347 RepID=A0AAN6NA08_9PEZI|nr:hypothetical protein QBC46DRAFT_383519 [Diplogelasinospora grovesii]